MLDYKGYCYFAGQSGVRYVWLCVGSARLFVFQHVGIGNAKSSCSGSTTFAPKRVWLVGIKSLYIQRRLFCVF